MDYRHIFIIIILLFGAPLKSQIRPSGFGFSTPSPSSSDPNGSTSANAASSAYAIKQAYPSSLDGVYWIDLPNEGPTEVYCLMDNAYDGGGWMLAMKATQGTTFRYSSSYWTSSNTLNTTSLNRSDEDAKYAVMNEFEAEDIMAIWPDISDIGGESGSIDGLANWTWLESDFNSGTRITLISKFSAGQDTKYSSNTAGNVTFDGFNTSVFSKQGNFSFYGFNYSGFTNGKVRWGFAWNNEANQQSNDVSGGIGMHTNFGYYSAGDKKRCCQTSTGINRKARVEIYIR